MVGRLYRGGGTSEGPKEGVSSRGTSSGDIELTTINIVNDKVFDNRQSGWYCLWEVSSHSIR